MLCSSVWLELNFGSAITARSLYLHPHANRNATYYDKYTAAFSREYGDGAAWMTTCGGHDIGIQWQIDLTAAVGSDRFRLTLMGMRPVLIECGLDAFDRPP